jgi:DNA polymerase-3 subunit epsilon
LKLIKDFELDLRLCSFFANPTALKEVRDFTAREDLPQVEEYNNKVTQAIESLTEQKRSFVIIDKGRESTEKSYVYFKDNKVHSLGFIDNELEFDDIEDLITQDNLVVHNFYMNHLVESFARLFPSKVMHLKGLPLEVDSPVNDVIY